MTEVRIQERQRNLRRPGPSREVTKILHERSSAAVKDLIGHHVAAVIPLAVTVCFRRAA